jgi:hypothetical protein
LARHPYKRWGEIDFLVIGPLGILALEVKGGRIAHLDDGTWESTNRYGEANRLRESPMRQAETALMALRTWLQEQLPTPLADATSFGWGVVFPDVAFRERSPEWTPETVGDIADFTTPASARRWLLTLMRHWQDRNRRAGPLESAGVAALLTLIRPEFELVPTLATAVRRVVDESNRLTAEQLTLLDAAEGNDRLLVLGGAGTGKTFIAAELARRRSIQFQTHLGLVVPWPSAALPYRGVIPESVEVLVADEEPRQKVDFMIVDEAQDFVSASGLGYLDSVVDGGLWNGHWAMFLDPNAQAGLRGTFDPEAFDLIEDSHPTRLRLTRNLRSSHEIAAYVTDVTGADLGVPGGGHGPDVRLCLLADEAWFAEETASILRRLRREGAQPGDVVVLTWLEPRLVAERLDGKPWPTLAATGGQLASDDPVVRVADPLDFQGLESAYVVMGPVPARESDLDIARAYVAGTRARGHLTFVVSREAAEALTYASSRQTRAPA